MLLLLALALAVLAAVAYQHAPAPSNVANPMDYASDEWTVWRSMGRGEARLELIKQGPNLDTSAVPRSATFRLFSDPSTAQSVWHHESPWSVVPQGWEERAWRGAWLSGPVESMARWKEEPGAMAAHWREGEPYATLQAKDENWSWNDEGWVVWSGQKASSTGHQTWVPNGLRESWWTGCLGCVPVPWRFALPAQMEESMRSVGVPLTGWSTQWTQGGRWGLQDTAGWKQVVRNLGSEQGWEVSWLGMDLVLSKGPRGWGWSESSDPLVSSWQGETWMGQSLSEGVRVWHRQAGSGSTSRMPTDETPREGMPISSPVHMGEVRNHRTAGVMQIVRTNQGVGAFDASGNRVWEVNCEEPLPGGAREVDVYANGKYQTMFCTPDGLQLVDVKGRQVPGFPLRGDWTAWALVDYDANKKYRYLLGSDASGLVENRRGEGAKTAGWKHRPDVSIDVASSIVHIEHLRLGSRDYVYVGRANGQVELLKRNGQTRALTPVRVVTNGSAPAFRLGGNLDGTSVLFVDAAGWVREFTLGQGEEVGLSGMMRADRVEIQDLDGDGIQEVVVWAQGIRTVWNARNEQVQ